MNRKFKERFEEELKKAKDSLTHEKERHEGIRKSHRASGQSTAEIPIHIKILCHRLHSRRSKLGEYADIQWRIAVPENVDRDSSVYFLRTNVPTLDEKATWDYYNLTREIECTAS